MKADGRQRHGPPRASGGEEATNAFRVVMDDLQSAILPDRQLIIDAVRSGSAR